MSADTERNNSYGFVVALGANKIEIKKAIENEYSTVESVAQCVLTARQSNVTLKPGWSKAALILTRRHWLAWLRARSSIFTIISKIWLYVNSTL